ncbi:MAG: DNA polymerase III subunit delta [Ruminococcus sp.]|nr:DNA polymerase III subunit delta [Ruminococcus sp.]
MQLSSSADILKKLRSDGPERVYYLYGRDVGALESFAKALTGKICPKADRIMNYHRFDGSKLDVPAFHDACEMLPMFAQRVLVAVNDLNMDSVNKSDSELIYKTIGDLPETTTVVIYSTAAELYKNKRSLTDKNKRLADLCAKQGISFEFAFKRAYDLAKSIITAFEKEGCSISKFDAEYLAEQCLCETSAVKQEIAKLSAYAAGRQVTRADIDALCIKKVESDGFALAINILRQNPAFVFGRIRELAEQNYEAFAILSTISMSLNDLYRARLALSSGKTQAAVTADFKYPKNREFVVKNSMNEIQNISDMRIRKVIGILSDTDLRLKTVSGGRQADLLTLEEAAAKAMTIRG